MLKFLYFKLIKFKYSSYKFTNNPSNNAHEILLIIEAHKT